MGFNSGFKGLNIYIYIYICISLCLHVSITSLLHVSVCYIHHLQAQLLITCTKPSAFYCLVCMLHWLCERVQHIHVCRYTMFLTMIETMFQIIQLTRCNSFTSLLHDIYVWLNMFRASPRPSSGAYGKTRGS